MLRLLLVRHGETAWNASRRYQGQMDVPLNEVGRRQAAAVADRLTAEPVQAIYASDLDRAWETALVIARPHGLTAISDPRLRELDFGDWQGLTYAQIAEQAPEALAVWNEDRVGRKPPGGESLGMMAERAGEVIEEIQSAHDDGTVVLVSHGGTIRIILCLLLEHPLAAYWQFEVDNTAVSEIEWRRLGPVVVRWNDAHHLSDRNRQSVF
ncbi:MAG: alpha-ribazole phosphatase [Anaerolineae bacterium]